MREFIQNSPKRAPYTPPERNTPTLTPSKLTHSQQTNKPTEDHEDDT